MLRIAICDDDNSFIKNLKMYISKELKSFTREFTISDYSMGEVLLLHNSQEPFDVVFLDIDMPTLSGFDIASQIREGGNNQNVFIIFVTSYPEFVYDSFNYEPLNFIVKGHKDFDEKFHLVMKQLLKHVKQNKSLLLFSEELGNISTTLSKVSYIESDKHYVFYHILPDGKELVISKRENISNLEDTLKPYDFIRIHKKYLVNLNYVFNVDLLNNMVTLKTNTELPLGRSYKNDTEQLFERFLRRL